VSGTNVLTYHQLKENTMRTFLLLGDNNTYIEVTIDEAGEIVSEGHGDLCELDIITRAILKKGDSIEVITH
jgi:hypothetical protein